jgi:hypothetical protein
MKEFTRYVHRLWLVEFNTNGDSDDPASYGNRLEVQDEAEANAVGSELSTKGEQPIDGWPELGVRVGEGLHTIVIDVDHPASLVPSAQPDHFHLYIDIPPVTWDRYQAWLKASMDIGLIQSGYYHASVDRKSTFLRLPWKPKLIEGAK